MRLLNKICIHHSLVDQPDIDKALKSFSDNHKERLHRTPNGFGNHISYHFVIGIYWEIRATRPINEVGYHASNLSVNKESIGICFSGNFDKHQPTPKQYDTGVQLIKELKEKYWDLSVHWHKEFANKSCPGNLFDMKKLIMPYYETLLNKLMEWVPREDKALKDIDALFKRIEKLPTKDREREIVCALLIAIEKIWGNIE